MSQFSLLKSRRFLPFFVTQFLGAFNDNIFKNTLMLIIAYSAIQEMGEDINVILNLAAALFILPYFLFSGIAGQVCDRYEKSGLIRKIKALEILIMCLAALGFMMGWYYFLLSILFLMGLQSTFFGPVKYAILPQHLKSDELLGGNAIVEMGTFVAILLGTIGAGLIMQSNDPTQMVVSMVLLMAVLGYMSSRGVPSAPPAAESESVQLDPNIFRSSWQLVKAVRENPPIFMAIMAISWFWFLGAAYLTQFPNFSIENLNGDSTLVTLLLAIFTLGIGIGSMTCEALSKSRIELGIVPIGALGLSVFGIDLYFSIPELSPTSLSWAAFVSDASHWRLLIDLFGIGAFGGIFIVPLYAFVQARSEPAFRARTIAVINIMNALFMVASALMGILFLGVMELSIPEFFLVIAIMNIVVCSYVFYTVDEFAVRFIVWMLSHTIYRVKHDNLGVIPEEGAAVLVCNHVSYSDAALIAGACPRPIRFVMDHQIFKNPFLGWFFKLVKAIPIAPEGKDKQIYDDAFDAVSEALKNGEIVCIFPEGKLTRDGSMNVFRTGVEKILERDPVPVVPLALIGLWGSIFSFKGGPAMGKVPKRFWSKVTLKGANPIPPDQADAPTLYEVVADIAVDKR